MPLEPKADEQSQGETPGQKQASKPGQMVSLSMSDIKELIQEIKRPSAVEQEKLDKEAALLKRKREESIAIATLEMEQKALRQANCDHMKPNGRPSTGGQIHSDGMVHMICLRCQKEFPPMRPDQSMVATGI